jgi:uncharacterized membrane protein
MGREKKSGHRSRQILWLVGAFAVGLLLRFWNLDLKPLWLDEVVTWVFSTGHRYGDIPLGRVLPLQTIWQSLTWQSQSCSAIAQAITAQSTHPPLFFCLMHQWMGLWKPSGLSVMWVLRSLPALFGVSAIAAVYGLTCVAYSKQTGLIAASLMAVSPFAVYLSQEARHYTLPLLLITLSLTAMVRIGQGITEPSQRSRWAWLAWVGVNSLGFYVHYFCLLAFAAQAITLLWIVGQHHWRAWRSLLFASSTVILSVLPWLPNLIGHSDRRETEWLKFTADSIWDWIGPVARLVAGGMVSIVMLPVESQVLPVMLISAIGMLLTIVFLGRWSWQGYRKLMQQPKSKHSTRVLGLFLLLVLGEYLVLVYLLHKDITLAFRYNFLFYPALCALLAAVLTHARFQHLPTPISPILAILLMGMISSGFVVNGVAFLKPFHPEGIAAQLLQGSSSSLVVVKDVQSGQDIALGLSFAHALDRRQSLFQQPQRETLWGFKQVSTPQIDVEHGILSAKPLSLWQISALHQKIEVPIRLRDRTTAQTRACQQTHQAFKAFGVAYRAYTCG